MTWQRLANFGLDVRDVAHLAGAVHNDKNIGAAVDEHEVIDDAAIIIEQQAVALFA